MSRIPRLDDIPSILRDLRIRLERLERGKAIVGGSGTGGILTSLQAGPAGTPIAGAVELDVTAPLLETEAGNVITVKIQPGALGNSLQTVGLGDYAATVLNLNPYLWYRLADASGPTVKDSSLSGAHPGTYGGSGVTYHVAPATGDGDYAVTFDGVAGYAHVGSNPTGTGDFAVAFFYKSSGAPPVTRPAINTETGPINTWAFIPGGFAGDGRPTFHFTTGSVFGSNVGGYLAFNSGPTITDNQYHLILMSRILSTGEVRVYVDGSPIALVAVNQNGGVNSTAILPGTPLNGGADLFLGASSSSASFVACTLDEFAIFHSVPTDAEVANLWANVGGGTNPVAAWAPTPAASIEVTDGTTDLTGISKVKFASGATVSAGPTGEADVAIATPLSAPTNYSLLTDPNQPALIFTNAGDVIWVEC